MNHALPSESYIARLDYLAFNGKVCSSVEYSDEQRFLEDLKESLYEATSWQTEQRKFCASGTEL